MLFLHTPRYFRWFGSYKFSKTMVDYQLNLDWWLENATLFPAEPVDDFLNVDELEPNLKANNDVQPITPGLSGLGWLDEKVDLSVFDIPSSLLIHVNETETLMLDETATLLDGLVDNFDTSYLPSFTEDAITPAEEILQPSKEADYIQVASPKSSVGEITNSPTSSVNNIPFSPVSSASSESIADGSDFSPLPIYVTISEPTDDDPKKPLTIKETLSIEEVSNSFKKRKYIRNGKKIPSVHVSLKQPFHPYTSESGTPGKKSRYERKKEQNKEAAARYRIKKRTEENELSGEVSSLESEQKELQKKHDKLQDEIKYLKSLMREMFKARGILK